MSLKKKAKKRLKPIGHGAATSVTPGQKFEPKYGGRIAPRAGEMKYTSFRGRR